MDVPLISFTFDDFPHTAIAEGGRILQSAGAVGTYYVSLGILNSQSPSGRICSEQDVVSASEAGHEIGCHTFSHCHSWDTADDVYENSLKMNAAALGKLIPGAQFKSFSYPISVPRPALKHICSRYFVSCRGGGQKINSGRMDLNQLSAYFLEKARGDFDAVGAVIRENAAKRGWLIFATHDVCNHPSPYGCTPEFFARVVEYAAGSGARILTVADAVTAIRSGGVVEDSQCSEAMAK